MQPRYAPAAPAVHRSGAWTRSAGCVRRLLDDLVRIANARRIDVRTGWAAEPEDLWLSEDRIARSPGSDDERVIDADGRYVLPGLWDAHVHMTQWALAARRLDVSGVRSVSELLGVLAGHLATRGAPPEEPVVAVGLRATTWPERPTGAHLDGLAPATPVALLGHDLHEAWVNRSAAERWHLDADGGLLLEDAAFRLQSILASVDDTDLDRWVREAAHEAAARGVVGIVDLERADNAEVWRRRVSRGFGELRVRASVWPEHLEQAITAGSRDGDPLDEAGLIRQGPLKVITDGSISATTAWCHAPYGPARSTGVAWIGESELASLLSRATRAGLECAVHAIGDAAIDQAIAAFSDTGARGSIEHAELATPDQAAALARLGLVASVQPQHLEDDRASCELFWPGRTILPLATMRDAGVRLALGSDAPVVALNPWAAIQSAVLRGGAGEWQRDESLTVADALRASTSGVCRLVPGALADLILVDENPCEADVGRLHTFGAATTIVGGRVVHSWI